MLTISIPKSIVGSEENKSIDVIDIILGTLLLWFPDMPCITMIYRDKKAAVHWSAARNEEPTSSRRPTDRQSLVNRLSNARQAVVMFLDTIIIEVDMFWSRWNVHNDCFSFRRSNTIFRVLTPSLRLASVSPYCLDRHRLASSRLTPLRNNSLRPARLCLAYICDAEPFSPRSWDVRI